MLKLRIRPDLCEPDKQTGKSVAAFKKDYLNCPSFKDMVELAAWYALVFNENEK